MLRLDARSILMVAAVVASLFSHGARADNGTPTILGISPGNPWPITPVGMPNPPVTVRFMAVTGASSYAILLAGPSGFQLPLDTFAQGDFIEASFALPIQANSGMYQLRIQALGGNGEPIGPASGSIPFNTVTQSPIPFAPIVSTAAGGVVLASSVDVPPGVTVHVPQGLTIYCVGPVNLVGTIEGGAGLVPGESGAGITINALGPMQVLGHVRGGKGADGQAAFSSANAGEPAVAHAGAAGHGGSVALRTLGAPIAILPSAHVESGAGGRGGNATATGGNANQSMQRGGDADSTGGAGGNGGDLVVYSQTVVPNSLMVSQVPGILTAGNGGRGGSARAKGGNGGRGVAGIDGGFGAFGGTTSTVAGEGGNSGDLVLTTMDWNGNGVVTMAEYSIVFGGHGGDTGATGFISGQDGGNAPVQPASCGCENIPPPAPVKDEKPKAGDGWSEPGDGGHARAVGKRGKGCGKGQDAIAKGGDGGNVKRIGFDVGGFGLQWNAAFATGGRGGNAEAVGGAGGPDGGDGGSATATGGNGGNGPETGPIAGGGGNGGQATAYGGDGGNAKDCCSPPLPARVPGGNGGAAEATGGKGGDAFVRGGHGGSVGAKGGKAGNGGDGCGPTSGGHGGTANTVVGAAGIGTLVNGDAGEVGFDEDGADGTDGVNCC